MAFVLSASTSPSPRENHAQIDEDSLASHVQAAFANLTSSGSSTPHIPSDSDMGRLSGGERDKDRPRLEIILDSETLYLKGTGVDVEPARLSGHVALYLAESTSIKEITLQFRGKARLPVPAYESLSLNSSPLTYIVCSHEWSFLEGEKKHAHTLKAGRHFFPFQLQIGGSLPSSIATAAFGGASVFYKLRAHAVRAGLHNSLQSTVPVHIIRSFTSEALEYQQTLEIENTWPEKLMYSIMIPHKAWAVGDTLTALVKFSPIAKGARVVSVTSTIQETTKVFARSGNQENTKIVATIKHNICGGKAVEVDDGKPARNSNPNSVPNSIPTTPSAHREHHTNFLGGGGSYFSLPLHHTTTRESTAAEPGPSNYNNHISSTADQPPEDDLSEPSQDEVVTYLKLPIPFTATPTHALEPIVVTHRIRWSILISNLDGHTSELRCSLPLCILDYRLLEEARAFSAATRRLLIGGPEVPLEEDDDDMELPSYTAHVRDRVANMFLPEAATMRVTNPWVQNGVSPVYSGPQQRLPTSLPRSRSGASSPLEAHVLSHLPHAPGSGDSTPLDWVNSELLLSLSEEEPPALTRRTPLHSAPSSRPGSTRGSRRGSRASSPERGGLTMTSSTPPIVNPNETYVHSGNASRNIHSLFNASMKPFTSLSTPAWLSSRSNSHSGSHLQSQASASMSSLEQHRQNPNARYTVQVPTPPPEPITSESLLHRAFTEVPDYGVASRGFIGGVPPLSSMTGLPSYADTEAEDQLTQMERSRSAPDLSSQFARRMRMQHLHIPSMSMTQAQSTSLPGSPPRSVESAS